MEKLGLNQPFRQTLPSRWMKYFFSYLLCWESRRRYWYRSLWGQFLRTVLYLEAIIYCLIISMQPKTSLSFSTQMPFTACPPHHQIQGTRNDILHEWDGGLKGWSTQWTSCFVVFLSSTCERCPAASHPSLLGEPQGGGRLTETEAPWRCLEAAAWLRHGWS